VLGTTSSLTLVELALEVRSSSANAERGLPIPRPSYNFLDASSRGERGTIISLDDGVVGDELEFPEAADLADELLE
jgi:hypothetical protein